MTDNFTATIAPGKIRGQRGKGARLRRLRILARHFVNPFQGLFQFARFGLVGLSGMVVDLATFSALLFVLPLPAARALSIWLAMTWNFFLNRDFTFQRACRSASTVRQYFAFCAVCLIGGVVNWSTTLGLCHLSSWLGSHPAVAAMFGVLAGCLMNYVACCRWIFQPSSASATPDGR